MWVLEKVMGFLRDASMAGEGMAPTRTLEGVSGMLYKAIAVCFSGFFLGTFILCFMLYPAGGKSPGNRISILDGIFIAGMIGTIVYYAVEFPTLANRIVEPSPEEIKKIEAAVPYLPLGAIPPNKAPGDNADKERKAFFYSTYWTALASMTDEAAYDFLKLTQDPANKELLGKIMSFWTTAGPDFGPIAKSGIPLHEGAAKFWLEKGVKVPPKIGK